MPSVTAEPAAPLRIALVAPLVTTIAEPQQGGSQALLADLAVGLTRHGHDVDVYAATGSEIPGAHMVDTGIESASLSAALVRHNRPRRSVGALDAAYEHVFGIVERGEYDVVHSHGFDPPALRRARAGRAPIIHTIHLPPEREAAAALREAHQGAEPGIVVGVSASQARAWSSLVRFDRVIRNGVPVDRIPWSYQPGRGLIFAGRLSAEKGAAAAIEIALTSDERIDLYGTAYDEDYARALRQRYGGDPRVTFHDALPRPDLWRRLAAARAVLCPIDWEEPFGLVAAEAQAAGTPVIAFARGGLMEIVDDAVTGFLVEPGNVQQAAAAVRSVDKLDRRRCRQHAVDDLNFETCMAGYEALYASVSATRAEAGGLAAQRIGGRSVDLPKHPVVHGHPIHAILSDGPVILIPLAIAAELWDRRGRTERIRLGDLAAACAATTASAAGLVGWIDWLTIPSGHPARRPATIHGLINTAAIVAVAAALPARRHRLQLLGAATAAIFVGAWIGGDLVFRHGWRVRPAEEAEIVEQRLRDPVSAAAFEEARREVADFERRKTFLPGG